MTDESALLAAILADPEDDTPRLVFADWLDENEASVTCDRCNGEGSELVRYEERGGLKGGSWSPCPTCNGDGFVSNGYAARAEFIRVQCEIFRVMSWRVPHNGGTSTGPDLAAERRETLKDLRKRERELFLSAYPENRFLFGSGVWTYCLPGTPVAKGEAAVVSSVAVVERGFVDSVSCPWETWRDHGDAIVAAQPVRRVSLSTWPGHPHQYASDNPPLGLLWVVPTDDEAKARGECDLIEDREAACSRYLRHRWPSVREWVLPPDPNLIPDHLQDAASAFVALPRMIEGEIINVPLPPTR